MAVDESHVGGSEGDDAVRVENVARVDRHDDAEHRHHNAEATQAHHFHRR